jgi:hypothetical protein
MWYFLNCKGRVLLIIPFFLLIKKKLNNKIALIRQMDLKIDVWNLHNFMENKPIFSWCDDDIWNDHNQKTFIELTKLSIVYYVPKIQNKLSSTLSSHFCWYKLTSIISSLYTSYFERVKHSLRRPLLVA